jgi:hypothetical protein
MTSTTIAEGSDNPVELVVNRDDIIIAVGHGWDAAASIGAADALLADAVIGRSLYDYVCGDDTSMFVRVMISGARQRLQPTVRPYRCDSPTHRRWMEMEMVPRPNGDVAITHRILKTEPMPQRVAPLAGHGKLLPKRCSICNRLRLAGEWHEPDTRAVATHIATAGERFGVIYGICPTCKANQETQASGTPSVAG